MSKRKRGGGRSGASSSSSPPSPYASSQNTTHEATIDRSLRSVLSLSMPRCSACGTTWYGDGSELIPMPERQCRTTLAVPCDFALPELPERAGNTTASSDPGGGGISIGGSSDGDARNNGDGPASAATTLLAAIRCPHRFSSALPDAAAASASASATSVWKQTATCRPCLLQWKKSANVVERYDYRDPKQITPGFTVEVKCPVCKVRFRERTVEGLLGKRGGGGRGGGVAGWEEAVESTVGAVGWAKRVRRRVRKLLAAAAARDGAAGKNQTSNGEEADARAALESLTKDGDGPACGHSSDEYFSDSDAEDDAEEAGNNNAAGVRHQMAAPGELRALLLRQDPLARQEDEDDRLIQEKLRTAKGRAELGLAERDVLVKKGEEVEGLARRIRRSAEEERRDEEFARSLADGLEEEDRRKRRRREREDELIARAMQEKLEKDVERELKKTKPQRSRSKSKRSSPFDNGRNDKSKQGGMGTCRASVAQSTVRAAKKSKRGAVNISDAPRKGGAESQSAAASISPPPAVPASLCRDDSSIQSEGSLGGGDDNDERKMPARIVTAGGKSNEGDDHSNGQRGPFAPGGAEIHVLDIGSDDDDDDLHDQDEDEDDIHDQDHDHGEACSERTLSSPLPAASAASSCSSSSRCKRAPKSSRCMPHAHSGPTISATILHGSASRTDQMRSEFQQISSTSSSQGMNRPPAQCASPPPVEKQSKRRSAPPSPRSLSSSPAPSRRSSASSSGGRCHSQAKNRPVSNGAKETRGKINEEKLSELVAMGFPEEDARRSYVDSKGDMEVAVAMLLSGAS